MASNTITDKDMGYAALAEGLRRLVAVPLELDVGVLDSAGADLVKIAAINELGGGDVPARPFLGNTWKANGSKYSDAAAKILSKPEDDVEKALAKLGADMVRDVQRTIQSGVSPANSASTLRRKQGSTPLINTGRLLKSISYRVGKR